MYLCLRRGWKWTNLYRSFFKYNYGRGNLYLFFSSQSSLSFHNHNPQMHAFTLFTACAHALSDNAAYRWTHWRPGSRSTRSTGPAPPRACSQCGGARPWCTCWCSGRRRTPSHPPRGTSGSPPPPALTHTTHHIPAVSKGAREHTRRETPSNNINRINIPWYACPKSLIIQGDGQWLGSKILAFLYLGRWPNFYTTTG